MILVTGASGLVGSHLLKGLVEKQEKIKALIRTEESIRKIVEIFQYYKLDFSQFRNNIEWVFGDITNKAQVSEAFKSVNKVYHCAASVSFYEKEKKLINKTNIEGTANVVNCCLENNIEKLVHISSIAAVRKKGENKLIIEENGWPSSKLQPYAYSKTQSEFEVWRGVEEGLKAVIVNPSVILGPGNWNSGSSLLFRRVYWGTKFFTKGVTGFVDVRDVVSIILELMDSEIHSKRFILNGANLSYETLFKTIAVNLHVKPPNKYASPNLTEFAWRIDKLISILTFSKPGFTESAAKASHKMQNYSSDRICKEIGFEFRSIEKTIRFACEKFLDSVS